jgi:hypothetical protein
MRQVVWIGCCDMLFVQIWCMVDIVVDGTGWCMVDIVIDGIGWCMVDALFYGTG